MGNGGDGFHDSWRDDREGMKLKNIKIVRGC
jgi:hypothetical protein